MKLYHAVTLLVMLVAFPVLADTAVATQERPVAFETNVDIEKLFKEKNFDAALSAATKATQANPKSGRAFLLLGRTQFYREQDSAAQVALDKAIELDSTLSEAWFFRGLLFVFARQPDMASANFKKATQLNPKEPKYWFELGKLNEREGKSTDATLALEKVVELDPKWASAWFALGTLASGNGDNVKAAENWEKALQIDPKYIDAHFNLGIHHQLRGDTKISLSHFLNVFEQRPQDLEAVKKIVQAYYRLEDYENASTYRTKLLDLIAKSKDPNVSEMREFCFDQFDAPGGRFFAYESIKKEGDLFNWFTFKLVGGDGKVIRTINLETSIYLKEFGSQFILGRNEERTHTTFNVEFKEMPSYSALKQLVLKANAGQLVPAASSTYSAK